MVRVTDTGSGIKPENLDHVFDVNFTTRQGPAAFGLGIGLPICREIVDRHGGTIEVQSTMGEGTTFVIRLPRKHGKAIAPASVAPVAR